MCRGSTTTSAWRRSPEDWPRDAAAMTTFDLLLQQTINGLSLGAMYALLALGFTLVYGILELINFSHFNVFMVGSFIAMYVLQMFGLSGQDVILTGIAAGRRAAGDLRRHHGVLRRARRDDRAAVPAPFAQREGAGRDDHHHRRILHPVQRHPADGRRGFKELPQSAAVDPLPYRRRGAGYPRHPDLGHRVAADGRPVHVRAAVAHRQGDAGHGAGCRSRAHDGRRGGQASSSWRSSSAPRWPVPAA